MPRIRSARKGWKTRSRRVLDTGIAGLRIAQAGGYFRTNLMPEAERAVAPCPRRAGRRRSEVEIPEAARARAAAYVITAAEGAALHLARLRTRRGDFDPEVRDRLIAGAMIPAAMVIQAQKFRRWYQQAMLRLFEERRRDHRAGHPVFRARIWARRHSCWTGVELPVRAELGLFTQPISFIGLPVVAVPVAGPMPIGVQIIAPPWREDIALRIARYLEANGTVVAQRPPGG